MVDRTMPASSRAAQIPEFIENILSFLPATDLLGAMKVNGLFHDCIIDCPAIQETMCLRPSANPLPPCYVLRRPNDDDKEVITLGLTLAAGLQDNDMSQDARLHPTVRLCPYLRLDHPDPEGRNRARGLLSPSRTDIDSFSKLFRLRLGPREIYRSVDRP
jgi:hypothetical protein